MHMTTRGCQQCYRSRPAQFVELHHNVGMLFMRQTYSTRARLCDACLHQAYFHHLWRNLLLGWWGTISFFATAYYLIANTFVYVTTLRKLKHAPASEAAPSASTDATNVSAADAQALLEPFAHNVRLRLGAGDSVDDIGRDLASLRGVPLADATRFVASVSAPPTPEARA
jgi:hypothetical protein